MGTGQCRPTWRALHDGVMHLLAAPDNFGTWGTARQVASAIARGARQAGWTAAEVPLSDGGEGFCEVIGGRRRSSLVGGPLGARVQAEWRLVADSKPVAAVLEVAKASGLALAGGREFNRALDATTAGTGELIMAAVATGAKRVIVGCGGSASTDGGWGAVQAIAPRGRLAGVELVAAVDVQTRFEDAARVFAAAKGASGPEIALLSARLRRLRQLYRDDFGIDVGEIAGSGAGGGLAGGLVSLGAKVIPGFEVAAAMCGLAEKIAAADLVITAEAHLDEESFQGRVVGGVVSMAKELGTPVVAVVAEADQGEWSEGLEVLTVPHEFGSGPHEFGSGSSGRHLDELERIVAARLESPGV